MEFLNKIIKAQLHFFIWILFLGSMPAFAVLNIEITGAGEHQIPISIVPFAGDENFVQSISNIVSADLARSGLFKLVDPNRGSPHEIKDVLYTAWFGVDALTIGSLEILPNGRIAAKFHLLDPVRQTQIIEQTVTGKSSEIRAIAHRIADIIFEKLTGDAGVFNTQIAYVNRQKGKYQLVIADSDGYDEKIVYSSDALIMSPAWSPDGSHLAFAAFDHDHAVIYVQSMLTNQRAVVANFTESNSAPAWSPNGRQLAFVLTNDGSSHLYLVRPDGSELQQMTFEDEIDTEPNFSPDGQNIIFVSDRSGKPQIYKVSIDGGNVERLTFEGSSNYSPHYSPDGKSFIFSSWMDGKFYVVSEDIQSKQFQVLTEGEWDENPSFAPNGKMILFASEKNRHGILATVSIDGKVKQKIFSQAGDILDPSWGPLIKQ